MVFKQLLKLQVDISMSHLMTRTLDKITLNDQAPVYHGERMGFEEFLERADDRHLEWVNGEVEVLSPASYWRQDVADFLAASLRLFVEAKDLGDVRSAPILMKTGARSSGREPDLIFLAKENFARRRETYIDGPADLVVEIVSPESQTRDREDKYKEYEEGGIREYWLIDPQRQEATFYQLKNGVYQAGTVNEQGIYHSQVIDGLWIEVRWLWQKPLPKLMTVLREWELI